MNLQGIAIATCLTGLIVTAGSIWVIDDHYQRTLRREVEDSTGQVGQLRVQAEQLRGEQAERRRELEALHAEIAGAEAALSTARAEAEDSRCVALHARVDAAVTLRQVQCYKQLADHAGCIATRERHRSTNTMLGVLLGAGVALATGGGSLALTAGGGLVGASMDGGQQCPEPQCLLDERTLRRHVLKDEGLGILPSCTTRYEARFLTGFGSEPEGFGGLDAFGEFVERGEFDEVEHELLEQAEAKPRPRKRAHKRQGKHRSKHRR